MTELEQKASEAWAAMTRPKTILDPLLGIEPMPAGVALDYVQNVTGDRDDAVTALLEAAAKWLAAESPGEPHESFADDVTGLLSDLRGECFAHAVFAARTIEHRCNDYGSMAYCNTPPFARCDVIMFDNWRLWTQLAFRVIAFGRLIVAAAYPEPV